MSVLDRKLFAPVRMHAGGTPPHAPWDESTKTGHLHSHHSEYSDAQLISDQMDTISGGISDIKTELAGQAKDEGLFSQALTDAEYFSKLISPVKTKEEYMAESRKLLESDYEAEKQAIARQKKSTWPSRKSCSKATTRRKSRPLQGKKRRTRLLP